MCYMNGRRPLPPGQARSETLRVRVRPAAADKFRAVVKATGYTEADAHREALADWIKKKERK